MAKSFTVGELFTEIEIKRAVLIWKTDRTNFHRRAVTEIVEPVLPRINKTTGQENDARYLAYMLEFVVLTVR